MNRSLQVSSCGSTTSPISHDTGAVDPSALLTTSSAYAVQLVRQVNYGCVVWKTFSVTNDNENGSDAFKEISENDLIAANFERREPHNLLFKVNIYKKYPFNEHHWRANIAPPAGDIDLPSTTVRNT
ncbi:hypothetical protein BJ875DRAFT_485111 [Amylocarpus encephaloides]|uniref:Uncharacterized protein n=1 Tax=Amylocarpus encephaloides TaxID=45428 RepID=A0A9P8C4T4_9HELO|nr:hypothetical protein BJ875DRAFT_485111 [Amylocarpus encephaloides]